MNCAGKCILLITRSILVTIDTEKVHLKEIHQDRAAVKNQVQSPNIWSSCDERLI